MKSSFFLLPNLLGRGLSLEDYFPQKLREKIQQLDGLICESEKAGRRYLSLFLEKQKANALPLVIFSEHTKEKEIIGMLKPLLRGETWGYIVDAGLPCLADPGSKLVEKAYELGINVQAVVGPSAIFLALMLSSFPAQRFAFHGYLPRERHSLIRKIKEIEKAASRNCMTHLWMETPYRTLRILTVLRETLGAKTLLCVAQNLTLPSQKIVVFPPWKNNLIKDDPSIFLISVR